MTQAVIKQGFKFEIELTVPKAPKGEYWQAALYCPSTNERFVADYIPEKDKDGHIISEHLIDGIGMFAWPSGLDEDLKPDPSIKNGTAHMKKGSYRLEIFTSGRSAIGTSGEFARVEDSNLMAGNVQ